MLNKHLVAKTRPVADPANIVTWKAMRITVLADALFRIEKSADRRFCDDATQIVWFRDAAAISYTADMSDVCCVVKTAAAELYLMDDLAESYVILADGRKAALTNEGNLKGTYRTLDACDGDLCYPDWNEEGITCIIELGDGVLSRTGVAVLNDSKSLLLKEDGTVAPRAHAETDLYCFAFGSNYRQAIQALYQISGAPPIIPRHALGNWWSRYWAYSQQEYLDLMDAFADQGVPFTVATVDMDWHPSKDLPGGESGWTGYSWNTELFPDYRAFLRGLHERGLHVTLNLHPALGVRWFETQYEKMARRMGVDPASRQTIPFNLVSTEFLNAYFDVLHKPYERDGVDFWWIDWQQGTETGVEGLDPLWMLNHYHSLDIAREKEQLILSRFAGVGSHRYPLGFSGDTFMTWKSLEHLIGFTAKASNVGYSWWSHDIGGHTNGHKDNELFVRFVQFGVFSPINRLHSTNSPVLAKEIVSYHGGAGLIAREYMRLRHAMLPFLYTAACETAEQGLTLIEPMYYQYPHAPEAYDCETQYLFSRQMIAAPITQRTGESGLTTRRVWLPEGVWTDFFTGDAYRGGRWIEMHRPLDTFPLLFKEGGFFVLDGAPAGNSTALPTTLDVHSFAGGGSYTLVEDEGGKRAKTFFVGERSGSDQHTVTVRAEDPAHILPVRNLRLRFRSVLKGAVQVLRNGVPVSAAVRQYGNYTIVTLNGWTADDVCTFTVTEQADNCVRHKEAVTRIMKETEGDNDMRKDLLKELLECTESGAYRSIIAESQLSEGWKARMLEILDFSNSFFDRC